jgi:ATP-dependent Zn protease
MSVEEKRRIAPHEAAHARVSMAVSHVDPMHRVTIAGARPKELLAPEQDVERSSEVTPCVLHSTTFVS